MRKLAWILVTLLSTLNLALAIHDFAPAGSMFGPGNSLMKGLDLSMRRNEAQCILDGVDPYLVWTQQIIREPYYPYVKEDLRSERIDEPINAYTPWEYPFAMIYTLLPKQVAWKCHFCLMILAFAAIVLFAWRVGGPWAAVAPLLFVIPANVDINVGNYALVVTAAIAGMLYFLERKSKAIVAIFWVIAMFKPQLGILFAIPLILKKQLWMCVLAGGLCVFLTIPVSLLCGVSPITLICEAPAASAHAFGGCALMPQPLLESLFGIVAPNVLMSFAMVLGLAVCAMLTWMIRKTDDWKMLFLPSMICAVSWTYVQPHSYALLMVVAAVFVADMMKNPSVGRFVVGIPAIALMARFARGAEIVVDRFLPTLSPLMHFMTLMSATVAFVLAVLYFCRYVMPKADAVAPR